MRRRKATAAPSGSSRSGRRGDLLGRRIDADAKPHKPTLQAVTDDRVCIGHLLLRGREDVEAFNANDRSRVFPNVKAAADAVCAAAQPRKRFQEAAE